MHADLKLWIGALERVASCTRGQVCGLHRGFSSYGSSEFRNAPMWEIPIALRSEMPEVPLFCDPPTSQARPNTCKTWPNAP